MGESKLSIICGLKVVDIVFAEDDTGIGFERGISLAIYNKCKLEGSFSDAHQLIGSIVVYTDESTDEVVIGFENNWELRVDMRNEAYTGPEAMQLRVPGEPIVIWS